MTDTLEKLEIALGGGEFIIKESQAETAFIPEEISEEQAMIQSMTREFVQNDIHPNIARLEKQEEGLAVNTLKRAGELGILSAHLPTEYGGMQLDTNTNTIICEEMGPAGAFSVTFAVQIGIGMLPILYFGTEAQKQKYLPKLATAEIIAAYCLTEPGSGSDALAAKTRADLSADGKNYILNGQKMWISNAGWADVFIVFAKIDGKKFTGFIVEKDAKGLTLGAEEDKLGIKGSSTRQVYFENVEIPVENVLGEIGKGHLIAFNVLNVGRFKLGALSLGGAKANATTAIKYANERTQFKQPIGSFGAIKYKLAEQAIRLFTLESAVYRTSNLLQTKKAACLAEGMTFTEALLEAAEEYAVECSIMKVAGSDTLDYVVDETLQIHGGIGYSEEYSAARAYRDARINRIYEGTNEINRLLMVDMLLKRAMQGKLDIVNPAWAVQKELASMPSMTKATGLYAEEKQALADFKKIFLMVAGAAVKMQMDGKIDLKSEQEILMNIADILTDVFMTESTLLRVEKLYHKTEKPVGQNVYDAILHTYFCDASARISKNATDALASFAEGDMLRAMLMGLKRFTKYAPTNVKENRRVVADTLLKANDYCL
jgi:alkylation response protein AidB-like acyl-CoA dehydrogenase